MTWEEGEDGTEILHRQGLAMPGEQQDGRAAENSLSVPSKAWTQPPVGFSAFVLGDISQLVKVMGAGITHLYLLL